LTLCVIRVGDYELRVYMSKIPYKPEWCYYIPTATGVNAKGHTNTYIDDKGNRVYRVCFEVDDKVRNPRKLKSDVEKALRDKVVAIWETKHGYHIYTYRKYTWDSAFKAYAWLRRKDLIDPGFFELIRTRYTKKQTHFLSILRVRGKYKEPDFRLLYFNKVLCDRWYERVHSERFKWLKTEWHTTELLMCTGYSADYVEYVLKRGKNAHAKMYRKLMRIPGVSIEKEYTITMDGVRVIATPDVIWRGQKVVELKNTANPLTIELGLMQLACYMSFLDMDKGELWLISNDGALMDKYVLNLDEGQRKKVKEWVKARAKAEYRFPSTRLLCSYCHNRRYCKIDRVDAFPIRLRKGLDEFF